MKRTLSPDEVIGEILAIGPHGEIGSLFIRFLYGGHTLPLPNFKTDQPNAVRAAKRSISTSTPWGVLGRDDNDKYWKRLHGDKLSGGNYLSPHNLASASSLTFPITFFIVQKHQTNLYISSLIDSTRQ
eukprot:scaffold81247_cov86-Cyclotella_meneghiniana.AAC.1